MATALVAAAVTFNAFLALVNARVPLSGGVVAGIQALLTAGPIALAFYRPIPSMRPWLLWLWAALLLSAGLALARQALLPRLVADLVTIAAFVLAGMLASRHSALRMLVFVQLVVVVVAAWELASPDSFAAVFDVRSYYVNTRGFADEAFWLEESDLFVSAERPGGRLLLPQSGLHRASSLFLEPVSLGNWTIVAMAGVLAFWRSLSPIARATMVGGNIFLLFACDGRLALIVNILLVLTTPFAHRLPRLAPALYLPALVVALVVFRAAFPGEGGGDTFLGRLVYSIRFIAGFDLAAWLGFEATEQLAGADSGLGYLILTQSFLGAMLVWAAVTMLPSTATAEARRLVHALALYVTLCLPVSYSLFSIKTAAPMWFLLGTVTATAWATSRARGSTP